MLASHTHPEAKGQLNPLTFHKQENGYLAKTFDALSPLKDSARDSADKTDKWSYPDEEDVHGVELEVDESDDDTHDWRRRNSAVILLHYLPVALLRPIPNPRKLPAGLLEVSRLASGLPGPTNARPGSRAQPLKAGSGQSRRPSECDGWKSVSMNLFRSICNPATRGG